jgi:hypothetical protein
MLRRSLRNRPEVKDSVSFGAWSVPRRGWSDPARICGPCDRVNRVRHHIPTNRHRRRPWPGKRPHGAFPPRQHLESAPCRANPPRAATTLTSPSPSPGMSVSAITQHVFNPLESFNNFGPNVTNSP